MLLTWRQMTNSNSSVVQMARGERIVQGSPLPCSTPAPECLGAEKDEERRGEKKIFITCVTY